MVIIQNLRRQRQVDPVLGAHVPRKLGHPLEKRPDDLVLGRLGTRALQPLELSLYLGALLFIELQRRHSLAKVIDIVPLVLISQLTLDLLELLP